MRHSPCGGDCFADVCVGSGDEKLHGAQHKGFGGAALEGCGDWSALSSLVAFGRVCRRVYSRSCRIDGLMLKRWFELVYQSAKSYDRR